MKKTWKIGFIMMLGIAITVKSCEKNEEWCMDTSVKNFEVEAEEDDGSCTFYTNTELLTASMWKFSSAASVDPATQTEFEIFLANMTMSFRANGSYDIVIPEDDEAGVENGAWEFTAKETALLLGKGAEDEQTFAISTLTSATLILAVTNNGEAATITMLK